MPPRQIEFAKLYLTNVVTGKRYIKKLVETGIVDLAEGQSVKVFLKTSYDGAADKGDGKGGLNIGLIAIIAAAIVVVAAVVIALVATSPKKKAPAQKAEEAAPAEDADAPAEEAPAEDAEEPKAEE